MASKDYIYLILGTIAIALILGSFQWIQVRKRRGQLERMKNQAENEEQRKQESELLAEEGLCICCDQDVRHQCERISLKEYELQAKSYSRT